MMLSRLSTRYKLRFLPSFIFPFSMNVLDYVENKNNQDFLIKLIKVIVIGLTSFSLLASAIPFYLGFDDVNYGIAAINLSEGNLVVTNELLQTTGDSQFIPKAYVITSDGKSAVPKANVGLLAVGALLYSLGGFYGLFYFGPIVSIILLIVYERIVSKFFGNLVGLLALLLLAADWQFFFVGLRFLTDNIFTLFFILGLFSFLKFFQNKQEKYILLCSTFFVISTLFRITGVVFLAVEVFVIASMYALPHLCKSKIFIKNTKEGYSETILKTTILSKTNFKKFLKLSFYLLIPWLFFILFWFSYNDYFFGDFNTNYREQIQSGSIDFEEQELESSLSDIKSSNQESPISYFERLNLVRYFSVPLISDPLYFFLIIISDTDLDEWRSDIWIGFVSLAILSIALIISLYFRTKRKETIILLIFIVSLVGFYSSPIVSGSPLAPNLSEHANSRYMIPVSLISLILIGNLLV